MKNLNIVGPYLGDPFFYTNWNKGEVEFIGKLATHHEVIIKQYYEPFAAFLKEYWQGVKERELTFNMKLTYFNTSGSKHLLNFFKLLENYRNTKNAKITINWYYLEEDIDMIDVVEEYEDMVDLDFKILPVENAEYWDNLNIFGDFISETSNFGIVKQVSAIIERGKEIQSEKLEIYTKLRNIIINFEEKLDFIPAFKTYTLIRLEHLLETECDKECREFIFSIKD